MAPATHNAVTEFAEYSGESNFVLGLYGCLYTLYFICTLINGEFSSFHDDGYLILLREGARDDIFNIIST